MREYKMHKGLSLSGEVHGRIFAGDMFVMQGEVLLHGDNEGTMEVDFLDNGSVQAYMRWHRETGEWQIPGTYLETQTDEGVLRLLDVRFWSVAVEPGKLEVNPGWPFGFMLGPDQYTLAFSFSNIELRLDKTDA